MKIADTQIGVTHPPYIVAEISGNHGGDVNNAIRLIKAAKRAGADAVKTQCYDPDSMTLDIKKPDFIVQEGLWRGRTLYELYSKSFTPPSWHKDLYRAAHNEGITIFSSVFDQRGVDLLSNLDCPAYKIASFEIGDTPLIEYAAAVGKPLIISTGTASYPEIVEADAVSGGKAAFLHCTSEYPATVQRANLLGIQKLGEMLNNKNPIGISDHTVGVEVPIAATVLSAVIIEKHICIPGIESEDSSFSSDPLMFADMVRAVHAVFIGLKPTQPDPCSRQFKRSLYATQDIKRGEHYSHDNIRSVRPGYGLSPNKLKNLIGKKSPRDWRRGEPLS